MFNAWVMFDEKLDRLIEKKRRFEGFVFVQEQIKKEIDGYLFLEKRINEVFKLISTKFGFSKNDLKSMVLPSSYLFKLNNNEIVNRFNYYIELFGNKKLLSKVIFNSSCFYGNDDLFRWEDMHIAKEQLDWLKDYFELDENSARLFAINNTYFFNKSPKSLKSKVKRFAEILNVDENTIKNLCKIYPSDFSGSTTKRLEEKIAGFARIFHTNIDRTKEIFVKYPFVIAQIGQYKLISSILSNHTSIFIKYPFIINLLDYDKKTYYGQFDSFEEFIENIEHINNNIGEIIRADTYVANGKKYSFCIVKKKNMEILCIAFGIRKESFFSSDMDCLEYKNWAIPYRKIKKYSENNLDNVINQFIDRLDEK